MQQITSKRDKPDWDGPAYYAMYLASKITTHKRRSPWCFSRPFKTSAEAYQFGATEVRREKSSLSFVIKVSDGIAEPMLQYTFPGPSNTAIKRYVEMTEKLRHFSEGIEDRSLYE